MIGVAVHDSALRVLTLLLTDIEDSTRLWEAHPDDMAGVVRGHYDLIDGVVARSGGTVLRYTGDGVLAAFDDAADAVHAAVEIQRQFLARSWPRVGELRLRAGVNTGQCRIEGGELFGRPPNLASRLESAAHGRQILVSDTTARACAGHLRQGEQFFDLGRYHIRGFDDPIVVHSVVADGLPSDFPPLRTPYRGFDELPADESVLIGREREVDTVSSLLAVHQLVTLWGPGGVGKTRIAQRVATRARRPYEDGVRFVDLSALDDPHHVEPAIAASLRAQPTSAETGRDTVLRALRHSRLLLVLDNCDAVHEGVHALATAIVDHCRAVRVLATAREALSVPGERAVEIRTLGVPREGESDPARVAGTEAVRLFVDRARAANPRFSVDDGNAAGLATLCRALDGLPLALELAAARLDVETIPDLVDDLPTLVTRLGGDADPLAGGRSVMAPLRWSLSHLADDEVDLFRRLGVFVGPFSRDVGVGMSGDASRADRSFDRLVRTSLVAHDPVATGRFRLLAPTRELARSLVDDTERLELRSLHARVLLAQAERWAPRLRTRDERACAEAMRADFADHRAAMEWLLGRGLIAEAARLVVALFQFALFQPRPEVYAWAAAVAAAIDDSASNAPEVVGAAALGAWFAGDLERAVALGSRAVSAGARHGGSTIWARTALVDALGYANDLDGVTRHYSALVDDLRRSDDPFWQINGRGYEALGLATFGRRAAAEARAEQALSLARRLGNPDCIMWALYALGRTLTSTDPGAACEAFEQAMDAARQPESRFNLGLALVEWVGIKRRLGDTANAVSGTLDLLEMLAVSGNRSQLSQVLREAGLVLADVDRHEVAALVLLARQGLPEMPRAPQDAPEDDGRIEELRIALGGGWSQLAIRAKAVPEHELISLCRTNLGDLRHAT